MFGREGKKSFVRTTIAKNTAAAPVLPEAGFEHCGVEWGTRRVRWWCSAAGGVRAQERE